MAGVIEFVGTAAAHAGLQGTWSALFNMIRASYCNICNFLLAISVSFRTLQYLYN